MAGIKSKIAECRQKWENNLKHYVRFKAHSTFIDRSKGRKAMCMVLAGYKEKLYPHTLKRFKMYENEMVDVVILSSGKYIANLMISARKICGHIYGQRKMTFHLSRMLPL